MFGSFLPSLWSSDNQVYSGRGADTVMQSSEKDAQIQPSCTFLPWRLAAECPAERVGQGKDSSAAALEWARHSGLGRARGPSYIGQLVRLRPKGICGWGTGPRVACHDHRANP